jgi:hypothetical protein
MLFSKLIRRRLLLSAVVLGSGVTVVMAQKAGQNGPPSLPRLQAQKAISALKVPEKAVRLTKAAPVPHKPFELRDANNQPINPNQTFKLPDGTQVTAREHVDELNRLEKALNGIGHSLRDRNAIPASLAVDNAQFARQSEEVRKSSKKSGPSANTARRLTTSARAKREAEAKNGQAATKKPTAAASTDTKTPTKTNINPDLLVPAQAAGKNSTATKGGIAVKPNKGAAQSQGKMADMYRPEAVEISNRARQQVVASDAPIWRAEFGDRSVFSSDMSTAMDVRAQMDGNGNDLSSSMLAVTQGGGYFFNNRVDIYRAAAILTTDHKSNHKLHLQTDLFGQTLANQDVGPGQGNSNTVNLDLPIGPIDIPIGPFYVSGKYLLKAKVGMQYNCQVDSNRAVCEVVPNVSSTLGYWPGGGVSAFGVKAGAWAGGTLTWINQNLVVRGEMAKGVEQPNNRPFVSVSTYGHNNFETLAGTLEFGVKGGAFGINFEKVLAKTTWPGVKFDGVIIEGKKVEYAQ